MISIKYKVKRDAPFQIIFAERVVWSAISNCFLLYDEFGRLFKNIDPYLISIESIQHPRSDFLEGENVQTKKP